tara:strand:- start:40378 stop:41559 length:1182 start_codon:yes stop_codon:yes gene_type:complete
VSLFLILELVTAFYKKYLLIFKLTQMKTIKYLILFGITLTFTFCSIIDDEESDDGGDPYIEVINEQEQTVLDPNQVFNKIVIEGATIINEAPPIPNGAINYSLTSTSTATIDEGFNITFNTTENIAGAYLLISDEDGNIASSYFDIPESAFGSLQSNNTNSLRSKMINNTNNQRIGGEDLNITINNFLSSLSSGIFCYQLCVYDSNGNISLPQTQCVTIETLGGNDFLVDRWYLNRFEEYGDGDNINVGMNEEFCYQDVNTCDNGNSITLSYCTTFITFYMDLYVDGTYRLFLEENNSDYDWEASLSSCSQVSLPDTFYKYDSEGIWAYNESNGKLFMAEYFSRSNENGEIYEEFYGAGNAQLLFDTPISIYGNSFELNLSEEGDQTILTFEK